MMALDCNHDLNSGEAVRLQEGDKELLLGGCFTGFHVASVWQPGYTEIFWNCLFLFSSPSSQWQLCFSSQSFCTAVALWTF